MCVCVCIGLRSQLIKRTGDGDVITKEQCRETRARSNKRYINVVCVCVCARTLLCVCGIHHRPHWIGGDGGGGGGTTTAN